MADVTTANTVAVRTGTNWTIDVTGTNLDSDLSVKDFLVLHNSVLVANTSYAKTTRTTLTYTGAALAANTPVEIRRKTPVAPVQNITYGSRFSSALWNAEVERTSRWKAETDVNGAGISGIGVPIPDNSAYGVLWASDVVYPPTRQAVYNKIQTMPTLASAVFTGTPQVPDIGARESTDNVANTQYIDTFYASKDSPILTGNPTAPTRSQGDSSTGLATTAFVMGERVLWNSLTLTGTTYLVTRGASNYLPLQASSSMLVPAGYTHMRIELNFHAFPVINDVANINMYYELQVSTNGGAFTNRQTGGIVLAPNHADNFFPVTLMHSETVTPGNTYQSRVLLGYTAGSNATKNFTVGGGRILHTFYRSNASI